MPPCLVLPVPNLSRDLLEGPPVATPLVLRPGLRESPGRVKGKAGEKTAEYGMIEEKRTESVGELIEELVIFRVDPRRGYRYQPWITGTGLRSRSGTRGKANGRSCCTLPVANS